MDVEIKRDHYLDQLLKRRHNGLIKVVTGIRRCGKSYLLRILFRNRLIEEGVPEDHIIEMPFDLFENLKYQDPEVFYPWILERIRDKGQYYILLDEVQLLGNFVSVLNGLAERRNCDVYVTGSNAKLLSKDVATEFGGRGDVVQMYPLSFSEFLTVYPGHYRDGLDEYVTFGGIPVVVLADSEEQKMALLSNLFAETYMNDIRKRQSYRNAGEMETLLDILSSSIGSLTNPNKLCNTFHSVWKSRITVSTITRYIDLLEDSFLIEEARRYDIKGRKPVGSPMKYYFMDLGLRNARIGYRQLETSHSMENLIYNELRMRGYSVDVGNLNITEMQDGKLVKKQLEVDFICSKCSRKYYIQSAYQMGTAEKLAQEIRPFLKINDSFRKIVITSDAPRPFYTEDGILIMSIYDFLRNRDSLETDCAT